MSPRAKAKPATTTDPGRLVDADWLAEHLDDADLRIVHVSPDRRVYNKRHIPGADVQRPAQGAGAARHGARDRRRRARMAGPDARGDRGGCCARWRVGEGDRLVFYDDVGMNRQAIRGYWLLRLYRFPSGPPAHPRRRDRGLAAGRRRDHHRTARGRPGRRAFASRWRSASATTRSSRPTTRSSPGAARRRKRETARPGSSTSGRPPSGSARTCAPSAAATSPAPASAASSTC